jgi:hypothetical protein
MKRKYLLGSALSLGLLAAPMAEAAYIVTLEEQGSSVVANGSGTLDTTDLTFVESALAGAAIVPNFGIMVLGISSPVDVYAGLVGPNGFGDNSDNSATTSTGDLVGAIIQANLDGFNGLLIVPKGYVSGNPLVDSSTYDNQSFSSLGVSPGAYEWTWGNGADADSFTIQVGAVDAVPEPGTLSLLGGFLLLSIGCAGFRRSKNTCPL